MKILTNASSYILILIASLLFMGSEAANAQYITMGDMSVSEDRRTAITIPTNHHSTNTGNHSVNREDLFFGLRCMSDGLNIIVGHPYYVGSNNRTQVIFQFDQSSEVIEMNWKMTSNQRASWIPMNIRITFSKMVSNAENLQIAVIDPFDSETHIMNFPVRGWNRAVNAMACSW